MILNEVAEEETKPLPTVEDQQEQIKRIVVCLKGNQETPLNAIRRYKDEKKEFEKTLIEPCNLLVSMGWVECYSATRSDFLKRLPSVYWKYQIQGGEEIKEIFTGEEMQTWREDSGYFLNDDEEQIILASKSVDRKTWSEWTLVNQISNFLV